MNWDKLNEAWEREQDSLRDGVYLAEVTGCRRYTGTDGREWLILDWTIPPGVEKSKWYGLVEEKMHYLRRDLAILGVKLPKAEMLEQDHVRESICGIRAEVKLATKGEHQNLWINKAVSRGPADEEPPPYTDDDIPF